MFPARIRMPLLIVAALLCPVLAAQRTHMSDIAGWNPVPASLFFLSAVMASHPFVEVVDARSVATDLAYSNVFADETFGDNITFVDRSRKNIEDCKEQAILEIWPDVYVDSDSPYTYYSYENDEYREKIALMEARFEECESRAPNESSSDTDDDGCAHTSVGTSSRSQCECALLSNGNCMWKYNGWGLGGSTFEYVYYVFAFLSSIAVFYLAYRKLGLSWGVFFFALHPLDVASNWALFIFFAQDMTQDELAQAWGFILFIAICSTFLLVPVTFVQARRIGLPVSEVLPSCCGTWSKWTPSPNWSLGITMLSLVLDAGLGAGAGVAIAINYAGEYGSAALLVTSAVLSLVSFGTELLFLCRLWEPHFRKGSCYADWVHSWLCYFDCCDVTEVFDLEAGEDHDFGLYCKNGGPTANHQSGPNGEGAFENGLCACKEADCANALYFYSCTPCCWSEYANIIKETGIGDPAEFWWCIYCGFDALSILQVLYRSEFKQLYGMPNNMCVNATEIWCCRGCAIVQMAEHARMYPRDKINHNDKNFNWHKNKPVVHVEPKVEAEEHFGLENGHSKSTGTGLKNAKGKKRKMSTKEKDFVAKATRIMTKKLGRDPTDEEVARKAKTLATKAAKAAEGVIKINPAFVE